ncbi:MAG: hypothetical protein HKP13_05820, partial [Gammaproteobacteria bacterium]|nr:hypothetical protein [Gammaproteobacteria bacterium]
GIARAMAPEDAMHRIDDVFDLIKKAVAKYADMENLPYTEIVKEIARYQGRPRRRTVDNG